MVLKGEITEMHIAKIQLKSFCLNRLTVSLRGITSYINK